MKKEKYDYINWNLIYEYKNGKRNGKGIEYNKENGLLKFEGEYLNGERYGKGKEYKNGILVFERYFSNGKKFSSFQQL